MTTALEQAISKIGQLPQEAQEVFGKNILNNVEKLLKLRTDVQKGVASIKKGDTVTMEEMRTEFNATYGV